MPRRQPPTTAPTMAPLDESSVVASVVLLGFSTWTSDTTRAGATSTDVTFTPSYSFASSDAKLVLKESACVDMCCLIASAAAASTALIRKLTRSFAVVAAVVACSPRKLPCLATADRRRAVTDTCVTCTSLADTDGRPDAMDTSIALAKEASLSRSAADFPSGSSNSKATEDDTYVVLCTVAPAGTHVGVDSYAPYAQTALAAVVG